MNIQWDCPLGYRMRCEHGVLGVCEHEAACKAYGAAAVGVQVTVEIAPNKFGIFNVGQHKRSRK